MSADASTNSKSDPCNAPSPCRSSLSHRSSGAPEMNQDEPLSATMAPCSCSARSTTRDCGPKPEMSTPGLRRNQAPIGAAVGSRDPRLVAGGPDVPAVGPPQRDPDRVVDPARCDLVVPNQAGQDRQPGGVGTRPRARPQRVGVEIEHRTGTGASTRPRRSAGTRRTSRRRCSDRGRPRARAGHHCSMRHLRSARSRGSDRGPDRSRPRTRT